MIKTSRTKNGHVTVTWVLPAEVHDGPVSVVGCFNDWTPGRHVLGKRSNGTRSASFTTKPGTEIRFRYLGHGGHWFSDPETTHEGPNGIVVAAL
jgi:hypothetical protein